MEANRFHLRFHDAWFSFTKLPDWLGGTRLSNTVRIPYPVPFRLLGNLAVGWLDVTYLEDGLRIARGNRGSIFVLLKREDVDLNDNLLDRWVD